MMLDVAQRLFAWLHARDLLDAGAQAEIARQLALIMAMSEAGKAMLRQIEGMTDQELDDWLKELGKNG